MTKEYQAFQPNTFRKHVHQEDKKQGAAPFFTLKCNIDTQIKISKEQSLYKQEWMKKHDQIEVDKIASGLGDFSL